MKSIHIPADSAAQFYQMMGSQQYCFCFVHTVSLGRKSLSLTWLNYWSNQQMFELKYPVSTIWISGYIYVDVAVDLYNYRYISSYRDIPVNIYISLSISLYIDMDIQFSLYSPTRLDIQISVYICISIQIDVDTQTI